MADTSLLSAVRGKSKSVTLCNKNLKKIPLLLCKVTTAKQLTLKNNHLKELPYELEGLKGLQLINLGNNDFENLPLVLGCFPHIETLHIFNNKLVDLNGEVVKRLSKCQLLNANNNCISEIPPEIRGMKSLRKLCLEKNNISVLPREILSCAEITELHLGNNKITELPVELGYLKNLKKLMIYKNELSEIPEEIGHCQSLEILDISCNNITMFPEGIYHCSLSELHCDENPLLEHLPVLSQNVNDVFFLKELCARMILKSFKDRNSPLRKQATLRPDVLNLLKDARKCVLCEQSYLFSWLECVHFVDAKSVLKLSNKAGNIPIRACLCSYDCFYSESHNYFAVSYPS